MAKPFRPLDTLLFMRRLADLTAGGIPLHQSVDILRRQTTAAPARALLDSVQGDLENGRSLSSALSLHPDVFSPLCAGLIRAGESSGDMEGSLNEAAHIMETEIETRQHIRATMAYPLFLLVISLSVCAFLTLFVIPRFEFLFKDLGQQLPLPTQILIGTSVFISRYGWILLALFGPAFFAFVKMRPSWADEIRHLIFKLPMFSDLVRDIFLQRWLQVMGSLIRGGFTLSDALHLSSISLGKNLFSTDLKRVMKELQDGRNLRTALAVSPLFPSLVCELVSAGEESGCLEETFFRLSNSFKKETELRSKLFLSLLEPLMIAFMGGVVGFVALAMLLPIFEMSASFH